MKLTIDQIGTIRKWRNALPNYNDELGRVLYFKNKNKKTIIIVDSISGQELYLLHCDI